MTTIAYRDGVLAADTMTSSNGILCTSAVKIGGRNGLLWAATGDAAWCKTDLSHIIQKLEAA